MLYTNCEVDVSSLIRQEPNYILATMLMGILTTESNGFVTSRVLMCFVSAQNQCSHMQALVIAVTYDVNCRNNKTQLLKIHVVQQLLTCQVRFIEFSHRTAWSLTLIAHVSSHFDRYVKMPTTLYCSEQLQRTHPGPISTKRGTNTQCSPDDW